MATLTASVGQDYVSVSRFDGMDEELIKEFDLDNLELATQERVRTFWDAHRGIAATELHFKIKVMVDLDRGEFEGKKLNGYGAATEERLRTYLNGNLEATPDAIREEVAQIMREARGTGDVARCREIAGKVDESNPVAALMAEPLPDTFVEDLKEAVKDPTALGRNLKKLGVDASREELSLVQKIFSGKPLDPTSVEDEELEEFAETMRRIGDENMGALAALNLAKMEATWKESTAAEERKRAIIWLRTRSRKFADQTVYTELMQFKAAMVKRKRELEKALRKGRGGALGGVCRMIDSSTTPIHFFSRASLRTWSLGEFVRAFIGIETIDYPFLEGFANALQLLREGKTVPKADKLALDSHHRGAKVAIQRASDITGSKFAHFLMINAEFLGNFERGEFDFVAQSQAVFDLVIRLCKTHIEELGSDHDTAMMATFANMEARKSALDPHTVLMTGVELRAITLYLARENSEPMKPIAYFMRLYCLALECQVPQRTVCVPKGEERAVVRMDVAMPSAWGRSKEETESKREVLDVASKKRGVSDAPDVIALIDLSKRVENRSRVGQCIAFQLRTLASHTWVFSNADMRPGMMPHVMCCLSSLLRLVFIKVGGTWSDELDLVELAQEAGVWERIDREFLIQLGKGGFSGSALHTAIDGGEDCEYLTRLMEGEWSAEQTYEAMNKTLAIVSDLLEIEKVEVTPVDAKAKPRVEPKGFVLIDHPSFTPQTKAICRDLQLQVKQLSYLHTMFLAPQTTAQCYLALGNSAKLALHSYAMNIKRFFLAHAADGVVPPTGVAFSDSPFMPKRNATMQIFEKMDQTELFEGNFAIKEGNHLTNMSLFADLGMLYGNFFESKLALTVQGQSISSRRVTQVMRSLVKAIETGIKLYASLSDIL